jgi:hypothetical protein
MLELRRDDLQLFLIHYSIFVLLYIGNIEFKMDSKNGLQIFNPKMPPNSTPKKDSRLHMFYNMPS